MSETQQTPITTRFKISMFALKLFAIISVVVIATDSYLMIIGKIAEYSNVSLMIMGGLIGFFNNMVGAYVESKKKEDQVS
jgi:hypothetical protein